MKQRTIILLSVFLCLLTLSIVFFTKHALLRLRVAFAEDQVRTIEELKNTALAAERPEQYLEAIAEYYPSGTKQVAGSKLDFIVETARTNALREIRAQLAR